MTLLCWCQLNFFFLFNLTLICSSLATSSAPTNSNSLFKHIERVPNWLDGHYIFSKPVKKYVTRDDEQSIKRFIPGMEETSSNVNMEKEVHDLESQISTSLQNSHDRPKRSAGTKINQKKVNSTAFDLHDTNSYLMVHWAGKNSSVLVVLTKKLSQFTSDVIASVVYFSYDYGKTFQKKITSSIDHQDDNHSPRATISNFYTTDLDIQRYVFTDVLTRSLYTTTDYGRHFQYIQALPFVPDLIFIHPTNPQILLGLEKASTRKHLYKSSDFGQTWIFIQDRVKTVEWGYGGSGTETYDKENALFVQRQEMDGTISVLRSETYFQNDISDQVIISNVDDFILMNGSMFATKTSSSGTGKDLWLSPTHHSRFVKANFPTSLNKLEFFVVDASDSQIMVCVNHAPGMTHLYISLPNKVDFTLSLENITYFSPKGLLTTLSLYASERFADIHKVNGLRSIYIANVMSGKNPRDIYSTSSMHSVITFDKGGMWERIPVQTVDDNGDQTNCSIRQGCSLHLTQEFHSIYPQTRSSVIFSQPSAPGFILAQGNVGKSFKSKPDLYFSSSAGKNWIQTLSGLWFYTWGDHGGIIVAVLKFTKTNELWYSINEGESWNTYIFYNETIEVYGLMTEPGEKTTIFTVFGSSNAASSAWVIIQVDLRNALGPACVEEDYKCWSPVDERGISCLMGSQTSYERKIKHSKCYNGNNFDRPTFMKNCPCTRDDFECDRGYYVPEYWDYFCVPDPESTVDIQQMPASCQDGGFYKRSKGYRKLTGDTCSGGDAENHYSPDLVPCVVQEENSFMLLSMSSGLYRVDLVANNTVQLSIDVARSQSIDFDFKSNSVFWTNGTYLLQTYLNTSITLVKGIGTRAIKHIAYDWFSENIYWTDQRIFVSNMKMAKRQLPSGNCTEHVGGIALIPDSGLLYILCYRRHHQGVYKMGLDGRNLTRIKRLSGLQSLNNNDLIYDATVARLFWLREDMIETAFTDGSGYKILTRDSNVPRYISVYKNSVYWSSSGIKYGDKYSLEAVHSLPLPVAAGYDYAMKIFTQQSRKTTKHNPCSQVKCTQLCVPTISSGSELQGVCLCGDGDDIRIEIQPNGQERCVCPAGQVYNITGGFCKTVNDTCRFNEYLCSNLRCISSAWLCDNDDDCGDGSDETDCAHNKCLPYQFQCNNTERCIPPSWACDHDEDCGENGNDEINCHYDLCRSNEFSCTNGRCKKKEWQCDGDNDCGDWSDEKNCAYTANHTNCDLTNQIYCSIPRLPFLENNCLPISWHCDGEPDCMDGSDEQNCTNTGVNVTCDIGRKACQDKKQCIYSWWFCDGHVDCNDTSDELNCLTTTAIPTTTAFSNCTGTDKKCRQSGACYPLAWHCDGVDDCGDHSDEFDCPTNSSAWNPNGLDLPCISELLQFRCTNGRCVFHFVKCDSDNDCGDWSDELGCPNFHGHETTPSCVVGHGFNYQGTRSYTKTGLTCQRWDSNTPHDPHYWPQDSHHNYCRNPDNDIRGPWCYTTTLSQRWDFCGIPHCTSSSSITPAPPTAGSHPCSDGYMYCGEGARRRCILERYICDGDNDCGNNADEQNCGTTCEQGQFTCTNKRCISMNLHCNYVDDCQDNSDESGCDSFNYACTKNSFKCNSSAKCIPSHLRCNSHPDCADKSDEQFCSTSTVDTIGLLCANGSVARNGTRCNYQPDCKDMSDEKRCSYISLGGFNPSFACNHDVLSTCILLILPNPNPLPPSNLGPFYYLIRYWQSQYYETYSGHSAVKFVKHTQHNNHVKLTGLQFDQQYSFSVALNFTNYTLPPNAIGYFTTLRGSAGLPVIENVAVVAEDTIVVEWRKPSIASLYIYGYVVQVTGPHNAKRMISVEGTTNNVSISRLSPGLWHVRVKAHSSLGYSNFSNAFNATIGNSFIHAPTQFNCSNVTRTSVWISWNTLQKGISYYRMNVRSRASVNFFTSELKVHSPWQVKNLAPSERYMARVASVDDKGFYRYTSWCYFNTLGPPTNTPNFTKNCQGIDLDSVNLTWSSVIDDLTKSGVTYEVAYGESEDNLQKPKFVRNVNHTVIGGLSHNHAYVFKVRVSLPFFGRWSDFVLLSPKTDYSMAPQNLKAQSSLPFNFANITWESPFSYNDNEVGIAYELTITDLETKISHKVTISAHSQETFQYNLNDTYITPYHMYNITVRDISSGKQHSHVARRKFFAGDKISPPFMLKVRSISETSYRLMFKISKKFADFYTDEVRGIEIAVCTGKDTSSPEDSGCSKLKEISPKARNTTLSNILPRQWYTVFLSLRCERNLPCDTSIASFSFKGSAKETYEPDSSADDILNKTNVIAIVVSALVIVACLVGITVFLVRRRRRLQQSYRAFVSSHYDPQSGEAFFVDDADDYDNGLDDDVDIETPMISGFADDEPLIVA